MVAIRRLLISTGTHRVRRDYSGLRLALALLAFLTTLAAFLASPPVLGVLTHVPVWLRRSAAGSGGLLTIAVAELLIAGGLVVDDWLRAAEDRRDRAEWAEAIRECEAVVSPGTPQGVAH